MPNTTQSCGIGEIGIPTFCAVTNVRCVCVIMILYLLVS